MGLLERGVEWLTAKQEATDSVTVVYSRDAHSKSMPAVVGRTLFSPQGYGSSNGGLSTAAVEWGDRDYLIRVEHLVLNGLAVKPQRGDRLTQVIRGVPAVFEISTPTGEPPWRYSDEAQTTFRIHCKRVG